jgi:hypothetical protein
VANVLVQEPEFFRLVYVGTVRDDNLRFSQQWFRNKNEVVCFSEGNREREKLLNGDG